MSVPQPPSIARAIYHLVDLLQIPLDVVNNSAAGEITKLGSIGPISFPFKIKVKTDGTSMADGSISIIIHLCGKLWAYAFASDTPNKLWIVFFDGGDKGDFGSFRANDWEKFLTRHASKIKEAFQYKKDMWKSTTVEALLAHGANNLD